MAFWKKEKKSDAKNLDEARKGLEQRSSERNIRGSDQPYVDPLNDYRRLEQVLLKSGMRTDVLDDPDKALYLHMYRQCIWARGVHKPLPYPIALEPPYAFMSVFDSVHGLPAMLPASERVEVDPEELCCFTIAMSPDDNITATQAGSFWLALGSISEFVSFEIVANCDEIVYQLLCYPSDRNYMAGQLGSHCPGADINPEGTDPDYLLQWYHELHEQFESTLSPYPRELGLSMAYYIPLRILTGLDPDPMNALLNAMGKLGEGYVAVFQALISPTRNDWKRDLREIFINTPPWENILRFVNAADTQAAREKLSNYPFLAVALRLMVFGKVSVAEPHGVLKEMLQCFEQYRSRDNSLRDLDLSEYPDCDPFMSSHILASDIIQRQTRRGGMLLNARELAGICHFPARSLQHPKLLRSDTPMAKAPDIALQDGVVIGINEFHGKRIEVSIPNDRRDLHTYTVGSTGMGKSILLLNMIKQDMDNGEGVGVVDPHGDLVSLVLPLVPESRLDDVVLFDPADVEYPMGLNLLSASGFRETDLVCSDLLSVFERLFDAASWGENIEQVMRMCILTLLESGGHTLRDIRRLLTNEVFRSKVVSRLSDPDLVEFWAAEFPSYSKATIGATQRRLSRLLSSKPVRNILSQKESKLDFRDIMDNRKILLCDLSRGKIGEDNAELFGRLLVSKIQISAMTRADRSMEEREPFYLYVDEFQNFVTSSFEEILSEARKYQLCLTLAHQYTTQLPRRIHAAVFGNVGTLIAFKVGPDDAQDLQRELGKFTAENIMNLEPYHTYVRIGRPQDTFPMVTFPPPEGGDPTTAERVREASRRKYATPIVEVEAQLRSEAQMPSARGAGDEKPDTGESDGLEFFEEE